jgi:hypothetical protein
MPAAPRKPWPRGPLSRSPAKVARWETIQDIVDALFPAGYDVAIKPKVGLRLDAEQLRCKIKFAAAPTDRKLQRQLMAELGHKEGIARREKYQNMTKQERQRIAAKARKTRRQNRLLRAQSQRLQQPTDANL